MAVTLNLDVFNDSAMSSGWIYSVLTVVTATTTGSDTIDGALTIRYTGTNISGDNTVNIQSVGANSTKQLYAKTKTSYSVLNDYNGTLKVEAILTMSTGKVVSAVRTFSFNSIFDIFADKFDASDFKFQNIDIWQGIPLDSSGTFSVTRGKASNNFKHSLCFEPSGFDNVIDIVSKVGYGTHDFTMNPNDFIEYMSADKASIYGRLVEYVYNVDGSLISNANPYHLNLNLPVSMKPTINSVVLSDVSGYKDTYGVYIRGKSILAAKSTATPTSGSTITNISYSIDNKNTSTSDLSIIKQIGLLEQSGNRTLATTVTDARNVSATRTDTVEVAAYTSPSLVITANRWNAINNKEDDSSTSVRIACGGLIPSINGKAVTGTLTIFGRKKDTSSWTSLYSKTVSNSYNETYMVSNQAVDSIWEYKATLVDSFKTEVNGEVSVGLSTPIMEWNSSGEGIGIGIIAPETGLDIGMQTNFRGRLDDGYSRIQITSPEGDDSVILADLSGKELKLLMNALGSYDRAFIGSHIFMNNDTAIGGRTTSGGQIPMLRMNSSNQVELNWTSGGLRGRVMKLLWSGNLSQNGTVVVPELPYYNAVMIRIDSSWNTYGIRMPGERSFNTGTLRDDGKDVYSFQTTVLIDASGTRLTNIGASWSQLTRVDMAWWTRANITHIYGVL